MNFNTFDGGVVVDAASNRPVASKIATVFDDETGARVKVYMEGQERTLVSGAHGLIPQFQTEDSTRRVRIEVGPVRLRQWSQETVESAADASGSISSALEQVEVVRAEAAAIVPRMEQIEVMAGLAPGEVTDAQTANLITQPATATRDALSAAMASEINTEGTPSRDALDAQSAQSVDLGGAARPVLESAFVRSDGLRNLVAVEADEPLPTLPGDGLIVVYSTGETYFEDFADGLTGWTARWARTTDWSAANGEAVMTGAGMLGRRLLTVDAISDEADVELVARVKHTADSTSLKSGLAARASGASGAENGYVAALVNQTLNLSRFAVGTYVNVQSVPYTYAAGAYSWIRFRVVGGKVQVRAWADGATEPATWQIDTVATSIPGGGWAGLFASAAVNQYWDIVGIGTGGKTAPKAAL